MGGIHLNNQILCKCYKLLLVYELKMVALDDHTENTQNDREQRVML